MVRIEGELRAEKRILVVDDDDPIRALLTTLLQRKGFPVDEARDGVEAIERCSRCHYSLVLLDLMMPRLSGYDVLKTLARKRPDERPIVIVLTAGGETYDLDASVVAGTVRKPFDLDVLVDTISASLNALGDHPQRESCPPDDTDATAKPN